jgi:hypothetical protein
MTDMTLLQSVAACDIQFNVRQFITVENVKYG